MSVELSAALAAVALVISVMLGGGPDKAALARDAAFAAVLQGTVHLVIPAVFLFLAVVP